MGQCMTCGKTSGHEELCRANESKRVSDSHPVVGLILDVELAKQVERSPEYYVCPYTGMRTRF